MRELTIVRQKSFVGCAGKVKIYIEDHQNSELAINGVPCRKLGELKNNQEQTFTITEDAVKLFAIYDILSKDKFNEVVNLPASNEPIKLTGKAHFNPSAGNPFRFEGITDEETLTNRKKGSNFGMILMIIAVAVGFVVGFAMAPSLFGN
ncbi:MAG: hypothetical protein J6Q55_01120 [Clostridia bacterium]|nr:hypothetical protein [Clostridia bacterium]